MKMTACLELDIPQNAKSRLEDIQRYKNRPYSYWTENQTLEKVAFELSNITESELEELLNAIPDKFKFGFCLEYIKNEPPIL